MAIATTLSVLAFKPKKHFPERLQLVGEANTGRVLQCSLVAVLHSKGEVDREELKNRNRQNDRRHCQEKCSQHLEYKALRTRLQEDTVHKTKGIVRSSKKYLEFEVTVQLCWVTHTHTE